MAGQHALARALALALTLALTLALPLACSWQVNELAICAAYVLIYLLYDKHVAAAAAAPPSPKPSSPAAAPPQAARHRPGIGPAPPPRRSTPAQSRGRLGISAEGNSFYN